MIKVHKKTSLYIIMKSVQQVDGIQRAIFITIFTDHLNPIGKAEKD